MKSGRREPSPIHRATLVALLLAALQAPAAASVVRGPLAVGDLFPARRGFLQPGPEPVAPLATGEWRLDILISAANTLARNSSIEVALEARRDRQPVTVEFLRQLDDGRGVLFVDGEDQALRLKIGHGLPGGWQVGFELPLLRAHDGDLDGLAEGFHDLFGLDQDGRFGLSRDHHLIFISSPRSEVMVGEAPGSGVGDLTLTAKRTLPSGRWQRGLDAALKLPIGDEKRLMSSGSADVGLRFLTSRSFGRWHLHGGAGFVYLGPWEALGTPSQVRLSGFTAIERGHANGASTVLQLVALESPFEDLGVPEMDHPSYQLTLGGHLPLTADHWLTLAVTENVLHFDSGSDFAFHVGISAPLR